MTFNVNSSNVRRLFALLTFLIVIIYSTSRSTMVAHDRNIKHFEFSVFALCSNLNFRV